MSKEDIYSKEEFKLKFNYEKKLTNNLKTNSKGFFSYLRNKRQLKSGVPSLKRSDGSRTASAQENAELLSEAFESVFVREPEDLPEVGAVDCNTLTDIVISHESVKTALEGLNPFKSLGLDARCPSLAARAS